MNSKVVNNYGSFDVTFKSGKGAVLKDRKSTRLNSSH